MTLHHSLLLLALAVPAAAQPGVASSIAPAQLQSDFQLFRKALEEGHSGLYRYTPKREMDKHFEQALRKLDKPLTARQFHNVLAPVVASIRCGHTGLNVPAAAQQESAQAPLLPLRLMIQGRQAFVLLNQSSSNQIRPGMELLAINGLAIGKVLDRILPNLSGDADIETGKHRRVSNRFAIAYWNFVGPSDSYRLRLRDANGKPFEATVPGVIDREAKEAAEKNPVNQRVLAALKAFEEQAGKQHLRYLQTPATAVIRIPGFGGAAYPDFLKKSFAEIKEKGIRNLIIDLRGNGGGSDMYGAMLVSYLAGKPFRYFERIHWNTYEPSFREHTTMRGSPIKEPGEVVPDPAGGWLVTAKRHPGLAEQQPAPGRFTGRTYVLIDGGSFSTTADFCAVTRQHGLATFAGEETGGAFDGNNSGFGVLVTLPASKIQLNLPMWAYYNAVKRGSRHGTLPDHPVVTRIADVENGVDTVLEYTLRLISGSAR